MMKHFLTTHKKSLSISFAFHLLLFAILFLCFDFSAPAIKKPGNADIKMVRSYLYQPSQPEAKPTALTGLLKHQKEIKQKKSEPESPPAPKTTTIGKSADELLALLHAAIQQKQHYPISALQMERQGRVKLGFTLFINGQIENLRIISSSGTESLDHAALLAVKKAVPFQRIENYLTSAQEYNVDVVFELA